MTSCSYCCVNNSFYLIYVILYLSLIFRFIKHNALVQYLLIWLHLFLKNDSWRKISMYEIKAWNENLPHVLLYTIGSVRSRDHVDQNNKLVVLSRYSMHIYIYIYIGIMFFVPHVSKIVLALSNAILIIAILFLIFNISIINNIRLRLWMNDFTELCSHGMNTHLNRQ